MCCQIGPPFGVPNNGPISTKSISSPHEAIEKCDTACVVFCFPQLRGIISQGARRPHEEGFGKNTKHMFRIGPRPPRRCLDWRRFRTIFNKGFFNGRTIWPLYAEPSDSGVKTVRQFYIPGMAGHNGAPAPILQNTLD